MDAQITDYDLAHQVHLTQSQGFEPPIVVVARILGLPLFLLLLLLLEGFTPFDSICLLSQSYASKYCCPILVYY